MAETNPAADLPAGSILDERTGEAWSPPATTEEGFALEGEYPHNRRLRAEALARAGKDTDPGAIVTDELIAETRKRLDAEDAAAPTEPSLDMTRAELDRYASDAGIDTSGAATKQEALDMITAGSGGGLAASGLTPIERTGTGDAS